MQKAETGLKGSGLKKKVDEKRHHFRELKCWQKGRELRKSLYQIAKSL